MTDTITHPRFIYEPSVYPAGTPEALGNSEASFCIRAIERGIRDDPESYLHALAAMNTAAEQGTLGSQRPKTWGEGTEPDAEDLLAEYFRRRYDKRVEFDDATEEALRRDRQHTEHLGRSSRATSYVITKGAMSHTQRSHPEAERLRDITRVSRLGHYVSRVLAWQEEQEVHTARARAS